MKVECRDKDGGDVYTHKIINDETECDFDYHGHTKFGIMKVECRNKVADEVYRYGRINETECKELGEHVDYYGHTNFGILALSPVLFSFLFTLSHWWKLEENWKKRLMSLPFLLLQCWPQYKMARILYLGFWKKNKKWRSEKETMERNVGSVGRCLILNIYIPILHF